MNSKRSSLRGCPIRESSDLCLFPAPRSVSPASAPFIVSECLGLHRKPSFLWPKKTKYLQHKATTNKVCCLQTFVFSLEKEKKDQSLPLSCSVHFLGQWPKTTKKEKMNGRVEIKGFEPLAPALQRQCSTNWAIFPIYGFFDWNSLKTSWTILDLNQWTSRLSSERSNQLS